MKTRMVAGLLALTVIATSISGISAQNNFSIEPPEIDHQWSGGQWLMNLPTGEQRQEMQQQMQMFLQQFCEQNNITYPIGLMVMGNLTDEHREEMRQQMQTVLQLFSGQYNINHPSGPIFVGAKKCGINDKARIYLAGFILGKRLNSGSG